MGAIISGFLDARNNPETVMVPPNLSGFKRVIISLPEGLPIEDILEDLVENDYINGVEEHSVEEGSPLEAPHFVIKRDSERQTDVLISYLNNKFGFIAHRGYVKPSKNIVVEQGKHGMTTTDVAKSTHVAIVQSPEAKNPNEQFGAFRREFDPETDFPKFERVDIEEIIHYTRPEDIVNANFNANHNQNFNANQASNALEAMTQGVQFDITETERVKDREAIKIDYVEKARKLRNELKNSKLRSLKKPKLQKRICEQFKYDHMNQLLEIKRKKYGIDRAKRIYAMQREQRLRIATMKQEIDPHVKPSEYEQHQQAFWKEFDYSTK